MATAIHHTEHRNSADPLTKDKVEIIPDIIEERRKDSEGRITINKFCTGKLLGKGGFAKCYLGTNIATNHVYALKIVSKSTLMKSKSKQKLQTEIKIHRTLRHTYVCKFERFFEDNTNVYIVLELCSNNSMSELLKKRKKLTEPEVRYYIIQLIGSIKYLHENLVIHRDLKLGNLFLDSQMRIKVGDFGLATKLTDISDRRKTFCGTPNYIAPEILQSKNGHSFEVDIWSTGVIIYTLLIGKPPFESKDVESTYKRILTNSFSFPENQQLSICQYSKILIKNILQTEASSRPKLDGILAHPFFTRSGAFTPTSLPETALREAPNENIPIRLNSDHLEDQKKYYAGFDSGNGNENDPHLLNRKISSIAISKQKSFLPDQKYSGKSKSHLLSIYQNDLDDQLTKTESQKINDNTRQISGTYTANSGLLSNGIILPGVTQKGFQSTVPQGFTLSLPPTKKEKLSIPIPIQNSSNIQSKYISDKKSTYTNKFDVYQDNKIQTHNNQRQQDKDEKDEKNTINDLQMNAPSLQFKQGGGDNIPLGNKLHLSQPQLYALEKPKESLIISSKGVGAHRTYDPNNIVRTAIQSSSSSSSNVLTSNENENEQQNIEINIIQSELEGVRLGTITAPSVLCSTGAPIIPKYKIQTTDLYRRTSEAWTDDDQKGFQSFPKSVTSNNLQVQTNLLYVSPTQATSGARKDRELVPNSDSEPVQLSPPNDQIISSNKCEVLGTLETMHEVLASKDLENFQIYLGQKAFELSDNMNNKYKNMNNKDKNINMNNKDINININKKIFFHSSQSLNYQQASIWVVRYVDYTSKYGLGFLLNTGSAGVYFNDSTKIVISPDGNIFQYGERRKKDKYQDNNLGSGFRLEHIIQTHLIKCYPIELQKKVTLLRHFRNYLVDLQKEGASKEEDGSTVGGREHLSNIAITSLDGAGIGATPTILFGTSSAVLEKNDAIQMGCYPLSNNNESNNYHNNDDNDNNPKMPFIKKWVRTRHAILFRLSNRTVQVLFFDRSEVLLSSEAQMVTYVDKQNIRSEHTLEDVLQTGRTDIAKRLKYAKDIMYRLISTQTS